MKQVLINADKSYLFPLPDNYDELIKNIKNIINTNDITVYNKSKILTKNNFDNLNDNLNILDISLKLNGGSGYPVITNIIFNMILSGFLTILFATFMFIMTCYCISKTHLSKESGNKLNNFEFIMNLNIFPNGKGNSNLKIEYVYPFMVFYVFSIIPSIILLYTKKSKCPSYKPPYIPIYLCLFIPIFIISIISFISDKINSKDYFSLYIILIVIFFTSGLINIIYSNKSLMTWEHIDISQNEISDDFYIIPTVAVFIYCILRKLLIIGNNDFGKMTIPMLFMLFTFSYVGISSFYLDSLLKYVSSPYSICY